MIIFLKTILITSLVLILIQDYRDRMVNWLLFPLVGLCCGIIHYSSTLTELFLVSTGINVVFVSILLLTVALYSKLKLKTPLGSSFGLGDVLLFYALTVSFSSVAFIILFISALVFSLAVHLAMKNKHSTVPLAGYISLFMCLVHVSHWSGIIDSVYTI